jgi:hypothetical protein
MNLSTQQIAILRLLAANDDLGHTLDDLLATGLPKQHINRALSERVALGLVQHFVCITEDGIDLVKNHEAA